jgi:hypothetical protein
MAHGALLRWARRLRLGADQLGEALAFERRLDRGRFGRKVIGHASLLP